MMKDQWRKGKSRLVTKALESCLKSFLKSISLTRCCYDYALIELVIHKLGFPYKSFLNIGTGCHSSTLMKKYTLFIIITTTCSGRQFLLSRKLSILLRLKSFGFTSLGEEFKVPKALQEEGSIWGNRGRRHQERSQ